jgi:uncharacterized protein
MRSLLVAATLAVGLGLASGLPAFADSLPTVDQIYQAEQAGHMDQAQQMISQVLKERPNSAKAHFIQSEIFAKQGYFGQARAELSEAERLDAKEDFANPHALQELKAQLGVGEHRSAGGQMVQYPRSESHFPWGFLLIAAVVIGLLMMVFRRRTYVQQYPAGGPGPGYGGAPGAGYGPGYGSPPMGGGGMGSGIVGGLASGLAVGAGVVAGEEVAHHFLDGDRREGGSGFIPSADAAQPDYNANADSGGNDFGVNDPGSWDGGGGGGGGWDGGGGGGGDDWS